MKILASLIIVFIVWLYLPDNSSFSYLAGRIIVELLFLYFFPLLIGLVGFFKEKKYSWKLFNLVFWILFVIRIFVLVGQYQLISNY